jgi:hypothetical protein
VREGGRGGRGGFRESVDVEAEFLKALVYFEGGRRRESSIRRTEEVEEGREEEMEEGREEKEGEERGGRGGIPASRASPYQLHCK